MKRANILFVFFVLFSYASCAVTDEEFIIVPKKSVVTSISSLKEECAQESAYALQKGININKKIADQVIMIFEGEKLTKTELEAVLDDLAFINKQLDAIERKLATTHKRQVTKK